MSDHDWKAETVGSLSEEAEKLLGAISQNLGGHLGTEAAECEWCPVCRTVRLVRDLDPEVKTHLTVAASALAQVAAALFDAVAPDDGGDIDLEDDPSGA